MNKDFFCKNDLQAILPNTIFDNLTYYEELKCLEKIVKKIVENVNDIKKHIPFFDEDRTIVLENIEENYLYVSIYGSDKNDGSFDKPFLTIDYALKKAYEISNDARIFIKDPGEYEMGFIVNTGSLHLTAMVDGVVVKLTKDCRNYSAHSTIQCTAGGEAKLRIEGNNHSWYFDGHTYFVNCDIHCLIQSQDSGVYFNNCNISNISGYSTFIRINNCTFIDPEPISRSMIYGSNSVIRFENDISMKLTTDYVNTYFLNCVGCYITLNAYIDIIDNLKVDKCYLHWNVLNIPYSAVNRLKSDFDLSDIDYNITTPALITFSHNANVVNVNSLKSQYSYNEKNEFNIKMLVDFNKNLSDFQSYTYYTIDSKQVFPISSSSVKTIPNLSDSTLKTIGYATLTYTDTSNNEHTTGVEVVAFLRSNQEMFGLIFDRTIFNSFISLTLNCIF